MLFRHYPSLFSHSVSQPIFLKLYYMSGTVLSAALIHRRKEATADEKQEPWWERKVQGLLHRSATCAS